MTRQEILNNYQTGRARTIKEGYITSPGKFEGEPIYAPYFYDMQGDGEVQDDESILFDLVVKDYEEFPELLGCDVVYLWEDDQGFVTCEASETSK